MTLNILLFGETADLIGTREVVLEVVEKISTEDLISNLAQKHPKLSNHKLLVAVNEKYVDPDTLLNDGDKVAVFTAVSGG